MPILLKVSLVDLILFQSVVILCSIIVFITLVSYVVASQPRLRLVPNIETH
jgi:hypothetical protein